MESQHQDRGRFHGTFRSMATRTCRKAGARDKHTGDVETTPCSARGEEDRSQQAPGKRPEERMGPLDSTIQNPPPPERRQDTLKKTARGNHPEGRTSAEPRPRTTERQRLQRKR